MSSGRERVRAVKRQVSWWKQHSGFQKGSVLRHNANLPRKPTLVKMQTGTSGNTLLVYDENRSFMREFHGEDATRIMVALELFAFDKTYVMVHFDKDGEMHIDDVPVAPKHWPSW